MKDSLLRSNPARIPGAIKMQDGMSLSTLRLNRSRAIRLMRHRQIKASLEVWQILVASYQRFRTSRWLSRWPTVMRRTLTARSTLRRHQLRSLTSWTARILMIQHTRMGRRHPKMWVRCITLSRLTTSVLLLNWNSTRVSGYTVIKSNHLSRS